MKTIVIIALVLFVCVSLWFSTRESRPRDMTIAHNTEIHSAYKALVDIRDKKKKTKADLEAAIDEAVGWLGQALE